MLYCHIVEIKLQYPTIDIKVFLHICGMIINGKITSQHHATKNEGNIGFNKTCKHVR